MHTIEKRREKRHQKLKQDKELLKNERLLYELWKKRRELPAIAYPKPVHWGWKRTLVLRDDIARRVDAQIFLDILKVVGQSQYCKNGDFLKWNYTSKKWEEQEMHIRPIGIGEWDKYKWSAQHAKHFYKGIRWWYRDSWYKQFDGYWFSYDHYMFVWNVEKHFHTHYTDIDPDLETEIARVEKLVWDDWNARARLTKLHGWRGRYRDDWYHHPHYKQEKDYVRSVMRELYDAEYPDVLNK